MFQLLQTLERALLLISIIGACHFAVCGAQLPSRGLSSFRAWPVLAISTVSNSFYVSDMIFGGLRFALVSFGEILDCFTTRNQNACTKTTR
jgi:hypothetical protein